MENNKELLTIREIAQEWRVSHRSVYSLLQSGEFPNAFPASGKRNWRIPRSDVRAYEQRSVREY